MKVICAIDYFNFFTEDALTVKLLKTIILISLAAIAIASFSYLLYMQFRPIGSYPNYDFRVQSTLRNAATAQEAFYVDNQKYTPLIKELTGKEYGLFLNEGEVVQVIYAGEDHYKLVAFHEKGSKAYCIDGPAGSVKRIPRKEALSMAEEATYKIRTTE